MAPLPLLALPVAATPCGAASDASPHPRAPQRADEVHWINSHKSGALLQRSWDKWLLQDPRHHVDTSERATDSAEGAT